MPAEALDRERESESHVCSSDDDSVLSIMNRLSVTGLPPDAGLVSLRNGAISEVQ